MLPAHLEYSSLNEASVDEWLKKKEASIVVYIHEKNPVCDILQKEVIIPAIIANGDIQFGYINQSATPMKFGSLNSPKIYVFINGERRKTIDGHITLDEFQLVLHDIRWGMPGFIDSRTAGHQWIEPMSDEGIKYYKEAVIKRIKEEKSKGTKLSYIELSSGK